MHRVVIYRDGGDKASQLVAYTTTPPLGSPMAYDRCDAVGHHTVGDRQDTGVQNPRKVGLWPKLFTFRPFCRIKSSYISPLPFDSGQPQSTLCALVSAPTISCRSLVVHHSVSFLKVSEKRFNVIFPESLLNDIDEYRGKHGMKRSELLAAAAEKFISTTPH